ncbi:MAG: NAD+ synthase [Methanoregula sp.]|nr:NAD+ synthase [Methanoregula sp.]
MRISLLQQNPVVGDLRGNEQKIIRGIKKACKENPDLIVTSELALLGYPPRDLLLQKKFIEKSWQIAENIAAECRAAPPVLLGLAQRNESDVGRPLFNVAALVNNGEVNYCFRKTLLPTYDVFDEDRYFEPAHDAQILHLQNQSIGISICEDIWNDRDFWNRRRYQTDPIEDMAAQGADLIINISASPFTVGKQQIREKMLGSIASKYHIPLVYVNQVGGNDDLIFDGRSCVFDSSGSLIARAKSFQEDILTSDLSSTESNRISPADFTPESEIWRALVLGTRDYVHKTGFTSVLLGLSGGIDSALVAAIATEALGKDHVLGILMPSPYSSTGSIDDASALVANLGIQSKTLPITPIMDAYDMLLRQEFARYSKDLTEENLQARIRGTLLMALSNKFGSLLLTPGNKSEVSVGYCTLYGDMCGAIGVISDVPKSMVYRIARWLNDQNQREMIPQPILTKVPSAELRSCQTDQDTLPPYDLLDEILYHHVELHESPEEIVARGYPKMTTFQALHMVKVAEFKRRQAAPGFKVTDRAFGTGWRMPIAAKEWYID